MTTTKNNTIDYATMNIGIKVESVDLNTKLANVRIYQGRKNKLFTDVYVSGLLASRMINEKSASFYEVGKKYSSTNNEEYRKKNPFQFIRYEKDGEVQHYLTVVEDAGREKIYRGTDVFGNEMYENRFRPWKKKQYYRRFVNRIPKKEESK
jgi:hypothetical protein